MPLTLEYLYLLMIQYIIAFCYIMVCFTGRSCRTVGSPAGECTLIRDCPILVTDTVYSNPEALAEFVRLYGCGYTR